MVLRFLLLVCRWGKGKGADGAPCVSSGDPILFDVVGGRTTAFVPAVQKKGLLAKNANREMQRKVKAEGAIAKGEQKGKGKGRVNAGKGGATAAKKTGAGGTADVGQKVRTVKDEPKPATKKASAKRSGTKHGGGKNAGKSITTSEKQEESGGSQNSASSRGRARASGTATAAASTKKRTTHAKPKPTAASNTSKATTAAKAPLRKDAMGKSLPATSSKDGQGQETTTSGSKRKRETKEQRHEDETCDDAAGESTSRRATVSKSKRATAGKRAKNESETTVNHGSNAATGAGVKGGVVRRRSPRLST